MKSSTTLAMGLIAFLFGCGSSGPYQKKKGEWYAKDKNKVFFCDTYRNSQEYWSIKHIRARAIIGADAATFTAIDNFYARDSKGMFYEGTGFATRDAASYTQLEGAFAHDNAVGYYGREEIPGSDGRTFAVIAHKYSKDATHVFFSDLDLNAVPNSRATTSVVVAGATPATFTPLESDYATDGERAYHGATLLETAAKGFRVLQYDYGISEAHVYFRGKLIKSADAASFVIVPLEGEGPTAKDKNGFFNFGDRAKKQ